jgi:hypothetical protein
MSFVVGKTVGSRPAEPATESDPSAVGRSGHLDPAADPGAMTLRSARGAVHRLRALMPTLAAPPADPAASQMLALDARGTLRRIDAAIALLRPMAITRPDLAEHLATLLAERAELAPAVERTQDPAADWRREAAPIASRLGLGSVDIRSDESAREVTEAKDARGVALGSTVYLHPERVTPGSATGREVLAHELVHLAQAKLPGREADQGDRDAAELEAAELATILADGGMARAPARPIDLSRPAADKDAALAAKAALAAIKKANPIDAAWMYVKVNTKEILAACEAQVAKIPLIQHARLAWVGNLGTAFREALVQWLDWRQLFGELERLIAPVDFRRVVDQHRELTDGTPGHPSAPGKEVVGPLWWNPSVGTALALEVGKVVQQSYLRMMPRFLIQVDEQHPQPVAVANLVPSHPMDEVMARMLCDQRLVGQVGKPDKSKKKDDSPEAFRHGVRFLNNFRWVGETDLTMWNWIEAIDPADPTPEDVAATIWGDPKHASRAHLLTKAGRYFRIHPGYAHAMPHLAAMAPADWHKPEEDNALALGASRFANDAAIEIAAKERRFKPKDAATPERIAGYAKTLQRSKRQLERMKSMFANPKLYEPLAPAIAFVDKHLDNLYGFPDERLAALQPVFDGQQAILFHVAAAVEELGGMVGRAKLESGALYEVLRDYLVAAGESFLLDAGRAKLARAKTKQATLALDSADELLNDTRFGVQDLASNETKDNTYLGAESKKELAGHQKKLLEMRATAATGGTIADGEMELVTAQLRQLQFLSKTRALHVKLMNLAEAARDTDNDAIESISNTVFRCDVRDMPAKVYKISNDLRDFVLQPYLEWQLKEENAVYKEVPGSAEDKKAKAIRINDQLATRKNAFQVFVLDQHNIEKTFNEVIGAIKDARIYQLVFQILLLVAVGVAGGVVGSVVGGAVRGAMLASTATRTMGMLRAVNTARVAGTLANITADAAVNTIGQRAILGKDGDSFLFNLGSNALVLAALRPLHNVAAGWKVAAADLENLKLWDKAKVGAKVALKGTTIVTAEMITAAGVSYAYERAIKGPPKDEATATQWVIQGASIALGRFISGRMSGVEQRLASMAMKDTAAWIHARHVKATAKQVEQTGDPQKAMDIMIEHQKVLDEEAAQLNEIIASGKKVPKEMLETAIRGNLAERQGVAKTALATMPLHLAGLTPDNAAGTVWYGTTEQIAIALHNAHRAGVNVSVDAHDTAAREWKIFVEGQFITVLEAPLQSRPRSARDMTDAELATARKYAEAAAFMQEKWERSVARDIDSRDVIEVDHLQVGYSIGGVMNQATMPSLGANRGNMMVVYEHRGTMSNRGQQEIGQDPATWNGPGIRTSEQAAPGAPWAKSADLDRALIVGRAELQTPAYQGRATALEKRPSNPTDDWKAPNRKFRIFVESATGKRWFYTDRYDNAGGMGPGLVHDDVRNAAKASGARIEDMLHTRQVVLGDDPMYFEKLRAGEILVWGGSPTGAWAGEPGVHAPKSRVDVVGDLRPKPGQTPKNWNELVAMHESVVTQIATQTQAGGTPDPALVQRRQAIETELLEAHKGSTLRRNTKPGATYAEPFAKGKVNIEYGTPTKIEPLPDGRIYVEFRTGSTLTTKVYDQIVLAHGQNPGAKGGPGELLGPAAAETAPGSREYGDVPPGTIALRPVLPPKDGDADVLALESIDPPGIRLVGASYAHPAMAPWIPKEHRAAFLDWLDRMKAVGVATRGGKISEDSTGVTPGIEHQRDKLPQANEAYAVQHFRLPGEKATLELKATMSLDEQAAAVQRFLTLHMRADGEHVRLEQLGGGASGAIIYRVYAGDHVVGVFKLFHRAVDARVEVDMLDILANAKLTKMKVVDARGMAMTTGDGKFKAGVLMDNAPGESVKDLIKAAGTADKRAETMQKLEHAMVKVAEGLAEFHTKMDGGTARSGKREMMSYKAKRSDAEYMVENNFVGTTAHPRGMERVTQIRAALGTDFDNVKLRVEAAQERFYAAEVPATAYLGDANAGNFVLNKHTARGYGELGVIDVGAMQWSMPSTGKHADGGNVYDPNGKGMKTGAADLARFLGSLETMFPGNLKPHEIQALRDKFLWAYTEHYKPGKTGDFKKNYADAEKWYRIELELTVLAGAQAAGKSSEVAASKTRLMAMLNL